MGRMGREEDDMFCRYVLCNVMMYDMKGPLIVHAKSIPYTQKVTTLEIMLQIIHHPSRTELSLIYHLLKTSPTYSSAMVNP